MSSPWTWLRPRASVRAFFREARSRLSLFETLHGYVYARWPYLYIGIATGEHPLAKAADRLTGRVRRGTRAGTRERDSGQAFADGYHGKVMPLEAASRLVRVGRDIERGDLETIIPYARARDLVLRHPDHIVVLECPCRASREHPCEPLDVCLIIGEPFAGFIAEHHPRRSRRITAAEAVRILEKEDARGHAHHAFFKDAMLGRFYAICNCCSCCCGAIGAHRRGIPMLASSGYVSVTDAGLCQGCGECVEACQFGALSIEEGTSAVDWDACMGCGVCVGRCPEGALTLAGDERKGIPLDVGPAIDAGSEA